MLIFLTNKVLSQRALDDNRLWEMVLEDHQKIVVLEAQLESLKTSINDLQRFKGHEKRRKQNYMVGHKQPYGYYHSPCRSLCISLIGYRKRPGSLSGCCGV